VEIGAIVAGKYRVDRILGQGGMGIVVQATHLQLGQPVAVKLLLPEVLGKQEVVQRFLREAQAAVRLKSEHVARVIDVGSLETGAPYMVLEYLDGCDLSQFPRAELDPGTIIDLMLQACEALYEAHSIGIIHRDIKPANFFITRRPDGGLLLKILDFGISKSQSGVEANLTGTHVVLGTPAYMSPEQMRSTREVDGRSDLWSLGIVMYELLQGTAPFEADTFTAFAMKVATDPLPPITRSLPFGLAEIVYRCLEKDRERRVRDVSELVRALAPYARSATQAAITMERTGTRGGVHPSALTIAAPAPATITGASGAMMTRDLVPTKARWPLFAGLGIALAAGIAIAVVASSVGDEPAATRASAASAPAASAPAASAPAADDHAATTLTTPPPVTTPPPAPSTPSPVATAPPPVATAPPSDAAVATPPAQPVAKNPASSPKRPPHRPHEDGKHSPPAQASQKPAAGSAVTNSSNDDILGARH
jgi:serine/threonine-protein kinase